MHRKQWLTTMDRTTGIIDIIPLNDIAEHIYGTGCFCEPKIDEEDSNIVIHNSLDQRESHEEVFHTTCTIN